MEAEAGPRVAYAAPSRDEEIAALQQDVFALTDELLSRYEEVTLLHDLSRSLGVVLDVEQASRDALLRSLQVVPCRLGIVLVGGDDGPRRVAAAGSDGPDGARAQLAQQVGRRAMERGVPLMLHANQTLGDEGGVPLAEPVIAAPILAGDAGSIEPSVGVLVFAGHTGSDRFTAGDAQLAAAVARQLGLGLANARLLSAVRDADRLQQEVETAAAIQRSLLPAFPPDLPGAEVAAACLPAAQVGGDYYDFVAGEEGAVHCLVADVSGHGIGSGLVMAMTRSVLRSQLRDTGSPGRALSATNSVMWEDLVATSLFITAFALRFEPSSGTVRYVDAGHHPALLRRRDGSVSELSSAGIPLGVLPDVAYDEGSVALRSGDALLVFSDGLVEAESPDGTMFGVDRLRGVVADSGGSGASGLIDSVLAHLHRFRGQAPQGDDVTLLALTLGPAEPVTPA